MKLKTMNYFKLLGILSLSVTSKPVLADLFKCNACPAGYKCDGVSKSPCPAGTYSYAGASSCISCPAGQYQDASAQTGCKSCPAGTYSNAGAASCTACEDNYWAKEGSSQCSYCSGTITIAYTRYKDIYKKKYFSVGTVPECSNEYMGKLQSGDKWCCAIEGDEALRPDYKGSPTGKCAAEHPQSFTIKCDKKTGELYAEGPLGIVWQHETW